MLTMREAAAAVRELREQHGWNQLDLASHAHVSRSFVADLEGGKPTVEASKLLDVFQALGFEMALRARESGEVRW
jgi:HTH-type transcriptional regulator/antitoxin HipB